MWTTSTKSQHVTYAPNCQNLHFLAWIRDSSGIDVASLINEVIGVANCCENTFEEGRIKYAGLGECSWHFGSRTEEVLAIRCIADEAKRILAARLEVAVRKALDGMKDHQWYPIVACASKELSYELIAELLMTDAGKLEWCNKARAEVQRDRESSDLN